MGHHCLWIYSDVGFQLELSSTCWGYVHVTLIVVVVGSLVDIDDRIQYVLAHPEISHIVGFYGPGFLW